MYLYGLRCRSSWVDVRDVAEAHVLALFKPDAGGKRIIVTSGPFKWQDLSESLIFHCVRGSPLTTTLQYLRRERWRAMASLPAIPRTIRQKWSITSSTTQRRRARFSGSTTANCTRQLATCSMLSVARVGCDTSDHASSPSQS